MKKGDFSPFLFANINSTLYICSTNRLSFAALIMIGELNKYQKPRHKLCLSMAGHTFGYALSTVDYKEEQALKTC